MLPVKTKFDSWKAKQIPFLLLFALVVGFSPACGDRAVVRREEPFRALVFTRTAGFRHDSIPTGAAAIRRLGRTHGFAVDTTADPRRFSARGLKRYDVVVFLSTTGTPIKRAGQRRALERFIRGGGGFVGVHAASDTRGDWPWYERLVGARFKRHEPGIASRTVEVTDRRSAATRRLPARWTRTDEWYEFRSNPTGRVRVLARLDAARPLAWCHRYDGGRSVYTAMGHTTASYAESRFGGHLLGAIEMAAGRAEFDCAP